MLEGLSPSLLAYWLINPPPRLVLFLQPCFVFLKLQLVLWHRCLWVVVKFAVDGEIYSTIMDFFL